MLRLVKGFGRLLFLSTAIGLGLTFALAAASLADTYMFRRQYAVAEAALETQERTWLQAIHTAVTRTTGGNPEDLRQRIATLETNLGTLTGTVNGMNTTLSSMNTQVTSTIPEALRRLESGTMTGWPAGTASVGSRTNLGQVRHASTNPYGFGVDVQSNLLSHLDAGNGAHLMCRTANGASRLTAPVAGYAPDGVVYGASHVEGWYIACSADAPGFAGRCFISQAGWSECSGGWALVW